MGVPIQKYRATITDTDTSVIGYVIETRKHLGSGAYDPKKSDYLICVTEKSMPGTMFYGTHRVHPDTIEPV